MLGHHKQDNSVDLDEIVERTRHVQFVCVTVIYIIKVFKDVLQIKDKIGIFTSFRK